MSRTLSGLSLSFLLVVAACSGREEGLDVDRVSPTGFHATYVVGHTSLVVDGEVRGAVSTARVSYDDGTVITELAVPEDRYGSPENLQLAIDTSAAKSADVIGRFATDKQRVTEMVLAYRAIAEGIDPNLDPSSALRSAMLFQPTLLTNAVLHLAPASLADNAAIDSATMPEPGYSTATCAGCAPNDDSTDYYAESTYQVEYDSNGNPISGGVAYRLALYGSGCAGACGPGCDWCIGIAGRYVCETNAFCRWHDAHCGAWEHFFDCHF